MELDRIIAVRTGKTVYRDGENCIKVFENGYPKDDVLSEALNHARVETTGLNVPAVKAVTQIDGKWAIVTEYIHGKTLDCLMSENHDRRHEYLGKFVDLQLEAFSKTCPLLVSLTEKMRDRIAKANLGDDVKTELLKRLEELPRHHKLCHGDFNDEYHSVGRRKTVHTRLVARDDRQRVCGRRADLSSVLAERRYFGGGRIYGFVLRKERNEQGLRRKMAADSRGGSVGER